MVAIRTKELSYLAIFPLQQWLKLHAWENLHEYCARYIFIFLTSVHISSLNFS